MERKNLSYLHISKPQYYLHIVLGLLNILSSTYKCNFLGADNKQ